MTLYETAGVNPSQGLNAVTAQLLSTLCCSVSVPAWGQPVAWVSLGSLTPGKMGLAGGLPDLRGGRGSKLPGLGSSLVSDCSRHRAEESSPAVWEPMCFVTAFQVILMLRIGESAPSLTSPEAS